MCDECNDEIVDFEVLVACKDGFEKKYSNKTNFTFSKTDTCLILLSKKRYWKNTFATSDLNQTDTIIKIEFININRIGFQLYFYYNQTTNNSRLSENILMDLTEILTINKYLSLEIDSFIDDIETKQQNSDSLCSQRALFVYDYLKSYGIDSTRLIIKSNGYQPYVVPFCEPPFSAGNTLNEKYIEALDGDLKETARKLNRRVEFHYFEE